MCRVTESLRANYYTYFLDGMRKGHVIICINRDVPHIPFGTYMLMIRIYKIWQKRSVVCVFLTVGTYQKSIPRWIHARHSEKS